MSMYVKIAPYYAGAAGPSSIIVACSGNFLNNGGTPYLSFFYEIDARASGGVASPSRDEPGSYMTIPLTDPQEKVYFPKNDRGWYYETIPNTFANNRKYARFNYKNYTLVGGKQEYVPGIKEEYVKIIDHFYKDRGGIEGNTPSRITPEVIELVDAMLDQVQDSSKELVPVHITFKLFWGITNWSDFIRNAKDLDSSSVADWIAVIKGEKNYDLVFDRVSDAYKPELQRRLLGLK